MTTLQRPAQRLRVIVGESDAAGHQGAVHSPYGAEALYAAEDAGSP